MSTIEPGMDADPKAPDWYDAIWLARYIEAQEIIADKAPERLREFTESFTILRTPPSYCRQLALPGFLTLNELANIRAVIRTIPMNRLEVNELQNFGRFVVHRWPEFTALQERLTERVSDLVGEPLEPSYNFLSLYTKMGICEPHLDAPSAKWTLDICIDQSDVWPIHFSQVIDWPHSKADLRAMSFDQITEDAALHFEEVLLQPGDAALFSGTNQWHFRRALPSGPGKRFCELLFLHYIPRGTSELVQPKTWSKLFDIPELAEMSDLDLIY
ncbi:MAG: hypothetical protein ABIT16_04695 [Croceibacterium sp.]